MRRRLILARVGSVLVVTASSLFVGPAQAADTVYTTADIAAHAVVSDCWTAIRGVVYNITDWIPKHPGTEEARENLIRMCGHDGSGLFEDQHLTDANARSVLGTMQIGYLPDAVPKPQPTTSPSATAAAKPVVKKTITCVKGKTVKRVSAAKCPAGWKRR